MITEFGRTLASGVLLLALTTTTFMQWAGAQLTPAPASVYTTDDDAGATPAPVASDTANATEAPEESENIYTACLDETFACSADETCQSCQTAASSSAAVQECAFGDIATDGDDCEETLDTACCLNELSEYDCLENELYVARWNCTLDSLGCVVEKITCDGADSTSDLDGALANFGCTSTVIAFSCAFMVLLPLL